MTGDKAAAAQAQREAADAVAQAKTEADKVEELEMVRAFATLPAIAIFTPPLSSHHCWCSRSS